MSKYLELADRCEKASGPDRELDEAIMATLFVRDERHIGAQEDCGPGGSWVPVKESVWVDTKTDRWVGTAAREFTASIDAAMTLADGLRGLSLHKRSNPDMGGKDWLVSAGSNRSAARSWPLALCAVGLRDRAKWDANETKESLNDNPQQISSIS